MNFQYELVYENGWYTIKTYLNEKVIKTQLYTTWTLAEKHMIVLTGQTTIKMGVIV